MYTTWSAKIRAFDKDLPAPTGQFFKIVSFKALRIKCLFSRYLSKKLERHDISVDI